MQSRRNFIRRAGGAAAGVVFTSCCLPGARPAFAQATPAARRREVRLGGRRVKTIDVHCHCIFPQAAALMGRKESDYPRRGLAIVAEDRILDMDAMGIDVEVLSINPFWYGADRGKASEVVKIQNDKLAEICGAHPDRFAAFASLALQFPELAAQQLEDAVKKLGLRGAAVGTMVASDELAHPKFDPVWAKAEELGVPLFIHPLNVPELAQRFKGNGYLSNVIGNPLDTTIALQHLIFEGTLDRFPNLKICSAHGGGYLGSYAPRSDHGCRVSPQQCGETKQLKKRPTEYLRRLHFDSLVFTPEALRHLVAEVGASQVVLGTDHPIPWQDKAVDHVLNTPSLSDAERLAILSGNAAKLLGIKV